MPTSFDLYYKAIQGDIMLVGSEPDGDTVRFKPDNIDLFDDIYRGHLVRPSNRDGSIRLRLEAIDAPETHYGKYGQKLGVESRDVFLNLLGYTEVKYKKDEVLSCIPPTIRATILTKLVIPDGRVASYMLVGSHVNDYSDGTDVLVDTNVLDATINIELIKKATVYPLLYTSTPLVHRRFIRNLAKNVKQTNLGIWPEDESHDFELEEFSSITPPDGVLIYPKLFRRSIDFLRTRTSELDNLPDWIREHHGGSENDLVLIDESFDVNLSELLAQVNDNVSLQVDILQMTFHEK